MKENYLEHKSEKQNPKIETITGPNNVEASISPERGGIITSLKFNTTELLYMDTETFNNSESNVKGGIPILFPNAGPLEENNTFPHLKQHGFARNEFWERRDSNAGFREEFSANEKTKEIYPYDFSISLRGVFEDDGSFTISQEVINNEQDKELPIAMGLHPYFNAQHTEKSNIKFNFPGGNIIEEKIDLWSRGVAISIDNPKIINPHALLEIEIPEQGTLILNPSLEYQKIWIWSLPDKDFICIEPVMRDANGLINDPQLIKPGESFTASCNIQFIKTV